MGSTLAQFTGIEDRINAVTDKIEKEYTEGKNIGKKPRILVTGSPSGGAALKVIRAIEDNGGVVVCFDFSQLYNCIFNTTKDGWEEIAIGSKTIEYAQERKVLFEMLTFLNDFVIYQ